MDNFSLNKGSHHLKKKGILRKTFTKWWPPLVLYLWNPYSDFFTAWVTYRVYIIYIRYILPWSVQFFSPSCHRRHNPAKRVRQATVFFNQLEINCCDHHLNIRTLSGPNFCWRIPDVMHTRGVNTLSRLTEKKSLIWQTKMITRNSWW